jgi:DNA-binding transcriptional LysR family regulator
MELRHLRYFLAVAEELSFSRAADRLGIAQPPLSQQIQALEKELGAALFNRETRPIHLTLAGQALLDEARMILAQLEQTVSRIQRIQRGNLGSLSIGFTSSMSNGILPNILQAFRHLYPDVNLNLREQNSNLQIQMLHDRQTDIAFVYSTPESLEAHDLETFPLVQEPLVLVLHHSHRLAAQSSVRLSDLTDEAFIMPSRLLGSDLYEQIHHLYHQCGFLPNIVQEVTFPITILGLVAGEVGISILPSSVQNLQRKNVVYRSIQGETPMQRLHLAWRRYNASPILKKFIEVAQAVANHDDSMWQISIQSDFTGI